MMLAGFRSRWTIPARWAGFRSGGGRLGEDLEGNFAFQPRITPAIDFPHAASAKRRADSVDAEPIAC